MQATSELRQCPFPAAAEHQATVRLQVLQSHPTLHSVTLVGVTLDSLDLHFLRRVRDVRVLHCCVSTSTPADPSMISRLKEVEAKQREQPAGNVMPLAPSTMSHLAHGEAQEVEQLTNNIALPYQRQACLTLARSSSSLSKSSSDGSELCTRPPTDRSSSFVETLVTKQKVNCDTAGDHDSMQRSSLQGSQPPLPAYVFTASTGDPAEVPAPFDTATPLSAAMRACHHLDRSGTARQPPTRVTINNCPGLPASAAAALLPMQLVRGLSVCDSCSELCGVLSIALGLPHLTSLKLDERFCTDSSSGTSPTPLPLANMSHADTSNGGDSADLSSVGNAEPSALLLAITPRLTQLQELRLRLGRQMLPAARGALHVLSALGQLTCLCVGQLTLGKDVAPMGEEPALGNADMAMLRGMPLLENLRISGAGAVASMPCYTTLASSLVLTAHQFDPSLPGIEAKTFYRF
jgi:hypothetical protein